MYSRRSQVWRWGETMKHTLAVLVENKPGVLMRVAGLFARRGFNIASITVGVTDNPQVSRMTIVVHEDSHSLEQVSKQLSKLVNVLKVAALDEEESVSRELALIKVRCDPSMRVNLLNMVNVFRAKVVDVARDSCIVECTGDERKIDALLELLREFDIKEVVRTGRIALNRGARTIEDEVSQRTGGAEPWLTSTTNLTGISGS